MDIVRAKKRLGQHFLENNAIAERIVDALGCPSGHALEIGAGMGVLTEWLLRRDDLRLTAVEIDKQSVDYLDRHFPLLRGKIIDGDFLKLDLPTIFDGSFSVIGNFPYNISSQILFRVLEHRELVDEVVGMFQKEVALRVTSQPNSKNYGILSVLLQAFYEVEYLFEVEAQHFNPPPKVVSAVIRLKRNAVATLDCDEVQFKTVVKTAFNQRRKTLRNSLKSLSFSDNFTQTSLFDKRPEQLAVSDFVEITKHIQLEKAIHG